MSVPDHRVEEQRVAVIGGGYTGLVAAVRLAEAGLGVTLFEASPTLGGLAGGFSIEGAPLEKAYHHIFRTDTAIIAMANELGVGDRLQWFESRQAMYYGGRMYPFAGARDLLRFSPLHFHNRIRAGAVALYLQFNKRWEGYASQTALAWMRRAAGKQVTEVIWEPLLRGKFHRYYDSVAMSWLWARIHVRANSKQKGELKEKLGYFSGGFEVFTKALVDRLNELGVEVRTSAPIESIESDESGVSVIHGGTRERYAACIATVPSAAFSRLIADTVTDQSYLDQLASIRYLGARLLIFSSEQQLSDAYWHNINDVDLPFVVFISHTQLVGTSAYGGKHVYYVATYVTMDDNIFTCPDDDLETIWFEGLASVFPDFDASAIREKHHFRFANAQHVVGSDYRASIPAKATPLPHVFLSNFSQIYPEDRGTNFAVRDGEAIAGLALEDLNR